MEEKIDNRSSKTQLKIPGFDEEKKPPAKIPFPKPGFKPFFYAS
jgi:hypothetical protein